MTTAHALPSRTLAGALFLGAVLLLLLTTAPRAEAATKPIQGYAWSSYLGWVHMNGSGYGVYQDTDSGLLSGYAWSPYFGWITFNQSELSGCPSGSCAAQVNTTSGAITGWARSCAAFANKSACSGSLDSNAGGWDGWIHLSGSGYGLTSANGCWSGYAWGSQNIGYMSFSGTAADGTPYKVGDNTCGVAVNGSCGSADGTPTASAPASNLCAEGTASTVSGTGPWSWSCAGTNGTTATCSAPTLSPDLTAGSTSAAPASGTVGEAVAFTGGVTNAGTGSAANFPNIIQIANSDASATVALLDAGTVASLAAGAATNVSASYAFSSPGTYQVRTCANLNTSWGGGVAESNANNNCGAWTSMSVGYPAITGNCTVSPASGKIGDIFTWSTSGVGGGSGSFTYAWSGDEGLSGSTASVSKAYASSGSKSASVAVSSGSSSRNFTCNTTATVLPTPTATLWASPDTVDEGQSTKLFWSSTGATSCTAAGGFATGGATSNASGATTDALTDTSTFQLTCTGPGGTSSPAFATVTVLHPQATITGTPTRVTSGEPTTISWNATSVNSCSVTGPNGFSKTGLTGSESVTLSTQGTYVIECQTNGAPIRRQVIINVTTRFQEF